MHDVKFYTEKTKKCIYDCLLTTHRSCTDWPHKTFIVFFDIVHPKDGRRRRPKHVGVVNKQSQVLLLDFNIIRERVCSFLKHFLLQTDKRYLITGLERPLGFRELETPWIFKQTAYESGKVVSPTHRPPLLSMKDFCYSFLSQGCVDPRAIVRPEK